MIRITSLDDQPTAVRRAVLRVDQLADWVPRACAEVAEFLYDHGVAPAGYPFARCHLLLGGLAEVEAGFPVVARINESGFVKSSALPGGAVLLVRYAGEPENVGLAYHEIDDWVHSRDAVRSGDSWEIYRDLPTCERVGKHIDVVQPIALLPVGV